MNNKTKEELKDALRRCKLKLNTLKPHLKEDKTFLNESYNKLLIEKAILKEKIMHKEPSFLMKLVKKIQHNKKELICDYFN